VPDLLDRLKTALADRYAIQEELGAGGMATVYLAEDLKHHRKVAVKVLRPELAAVVGAERFLHEIQIAAKLNHPHILTLIDSGEADGFLYYVMPYVQGESLRDKLQREKQLSVEEALTITQDVASAMAYAHIQGVIHRDLKPGNILLHEGEAMVADFGLALALRAAGGQRLTETGLSLGTTLAGGVRTPWDWLQYVLFFRGHQPSGGDDRGLPSTGRSRAAKRSSVVFGHGNRPIRHREPRLSVGVVGARRRRS